MPQKSFEEQLRDKTKGFTPEPKEGLWEGIEAHLLPEKKEKKRMLWLPLIAASCILAIGISYIYTTSYKESVSIAQNEMAGDDKIQEFKEENQQSLLNPVSKSLENQEIAQAHQSKGLLESRKSSNTADRTYENKDQSIDQSNSSGPYRLNSNHSDHSDDTELGLQYEEDKTSGSLEGIADQGNSSNDEIAMPTEQSAIEVDKTALKTIMSIDSELIVVKTILPPDSTKKVAVISLKERFKHPIGLGSSRKYIEAIISPVLSGSRISMAREFKDSMPYKSWAEDRKSMDKKAWSFGFGFMAGIEKRRYHISAGLYYQTLAYQVFVMNVDSRVLRGIAANFSNFDYNATDSFAMAYTKTAYTGGGNVNGVGNYVTNRFHYLSIPLNMAYNLKAKGRFHVGLSANISPQLLLSYNGLLYQQESGLYVKEKSAMENHIRKYNLTTSAGLELNYLTGISSSVLFRPQYGISLFPAEKSSINAGHRLWSFSFAYRKYF